MVRPHSLFYKFSPIGSENYASFQISQRVSILEQEIHQFQFF